MYLTWRKLRDDYQEEDLISYGWLAVLGMMLFSRLAYGFLNWGVWNENWWDWLLFWEKPGTNIIAGYLGILLTSWWWTLAKNWKFWSFLEDMTDNFLILFTLVVVDEIIRSWIDWRWFGVMGLLILTTVATKILFGKYRSFSWYRSGKKGFVFLVANILFWLGWFGISGNYLGLIMGLISLFGLVILGDVLVFLKILWRRK